MITIASEAMSAEIDPLGAELQTMKDGQERDLPWHQDSAV